MLGTLGDTASERKLRLYGVACCRRVGHLVDFPEFIRAVDVAEEYADGWVSTAELRAAKRSAERVAEESRAPGLHLRKAEAAVIEASETWPSDFQHPVETARRD